MRGNTFGEFLTVTVGGESHGPEITAIVDGVPSGILITSDIIQTDLDRRRPGQSEYTTPRVESDQVRITGGVYEDVSTGAPIVLSIPSSNKRSEDYHAIQGLYRPGHADITYDLKYGFRDPDGGGRSSYRVMAGVVAAGAIAKQIVPVRFTTYVQQVGHIHAIVNELPSIEDIERSPIRCPDVEASRRMEELILRVADEGDSVGGSIAFVIDRIEAGFGEPIFDKVNALLGAAMLAINATTGVEFGGGFKAASMWGAEYNDQIVGKTKDKVTTTTNNGGGSQGGISNGMPIYGRVAFHPTSSIRKSQNTIDVEGEAATISTEGRHDPCVLPRAVPAVEAMAALVMADLYLRRRLDRAS